MTPRTTTVVSRSIALFAMTLLSGVAFAQTTLVVPFSPGGGGDTMARSIAPLLEKALDTPIIVTNKAGAAGQIGLASVAKGEGKGQTLGYATFGTLCMNPKLYPGAQDTVDNLDVLATLGRVPLMLAVSKTRYPNVNTWQDVLALWKASPEGLNIATAGVGSASGEGARRLGEVTHLPYKAINFQGAGPALLSLEGGHTDLMMDTPPNLLKADPQRVTLILVTSDEPLSIAPSIPTAKSLGVPALTHGVWDALVVPKTMPEVERARLTEGLSRFLADPQLKILFERKGVEPYPNLKPSLPILCHDTL